MVGLFYENELQMISEAKFRCEKVIKRKSDELYVIWKCDNFLWGKYEMWIRSM